MGSKRVQIKVNSKVIIEAEGKNHTELFEELSGLQEVFADDLCGVCKNNREDGWPSKGIRIVVRENGKFKFYELHCLDCHSRLVFGQSDGGILFPKRRWAQLSDNEKEQRADQEQYAEEHKGYLPNNGWFKWKKKED
jgi:hypothetical protein